MIHWEETAEGFAYGKWSVIETAEKSWMVNDPNGEPYPIVFKDVNRALRFAEKRMERQETR